MNAQAINLRPIAHHSRFEMAVCNDMAMHDCFRILKVREGSSWKVIKKSYHALATEFHPDRNPDDPFCENRFKKISQAFEYLEQHYTENHTVMVNAVEPSGGGSAGHPQTDPLPGVPATDWKKFVGYWSQQVLQFLRDSERVLLMLDVKRTVNINHEIAAHGGSIRIKTPRESFYVTVPNGSSNDFSVRIPGKGDAGILNRVRGDLLLRIRVQTNPHAVQRADYYYRVTVPMNRSDMDRVRILQTHQGPLQYTLPKKPFNGQTLVFKVPSSNQIPPPANHIIVINLV